MIARNTLEERIALAAELGEVADLSDLGIKARTIDPKFLRALLLGKVEVEVPPHPRRKIEVDPLGVRIRYGVFREEIDLSRVEWGFPLELTHGVFSKSVSFWDARLRAIDLSRSRFRSLVGLVDAEIAQDLRANGARFLDGLDIRAAEIQGELDLVGARLTVLHADRPALHAADIEVDGAVRMNSDSGIGRFAAVGKVDLSGATIGGALEMAGASFSNPSGVAIFADGAKIGGDVLMRAQQGGPRFEAEGEVRLPGATINRSWVMDGGSFSNPSGDAISADGAKIGGGVFMREQKGGSRFEAVGKVRLLGATIDGGWEMDGASFSNPSGVAIGADGAKIGGDVFMQEQEGGSRFEAAGQVRIIGATIDGQWSLIGGSFSNPSGDAIDAQGAKIGGGVFMQAQEGGHRFEAVGEVRLLGATIGGQWSLIGGSFSNPSGVSINAQGAKIGGHVFMRAQEGGSRFEAVGTVRLPGATIDGQWSLIGASFSNPSGVAINADGAKIGGDVFMQAQKVGPRFEAVGEVRLLGATIDGQWSLIGASFSNPSGVAINADRAKIGGSVFMREQQGGPRFEAAGEVRLLGATIGGQWSLFGGSFSNPSGVAINADSAKIGGSVLMRAGAQEPVCQGRADFVHAEIGDLFQWRGVTGRHSVALSHATAAVLDLSAPPPTGKEPRFEGWLLNGFQYENLDDPKTAAESTMLELIRTADGGRFFPQPYRQLFRVLRAQGHAEEATRVAIEMRKDDLADSLEKARWPRTWFLRCWRLLAASVGYGYRPTLALRWAFCFVAIAAVIYGIVDATGYLPAYMAPVQGDVLVSEDFATGEWLTKGPSFSPIMYSLDQFLPIVDFGQASYFRPKHSTGHLRFGIDTAWWLTWLDWFLIVSGWTLSTLFVSAVSGFMRKVDADE